MRIFHPVHQVAAPGTKSAPSLITSCFTFRFYVRSV